MTVPRSLAALAALFTAACSATPPKLQQGLWEFRGSVSENQGTKHTDFFFKLCRDHKYDAAQAAEIENRNGCITTVAKTAALQFTSSSKCRILGTTIASQGVTTYSKGNRVHSQTQATYSPALNGKIDESIVQDQYFLGACPASMRVGDLIGADGLIRHQT